MTLNGFVCAQKIIFVNVEHDVNSDFMKMDVILKNRTNSSPVADVNAVLFHDLEEPIFVSYKRKIFPAEQRNVVVIFYFYFFLCAIVCGHR